MLRIWIAIILLFVQAGRAGVPGIPGAARSHWAYQPVRSATPPPGVGSGWARGEIDRFIFARAKGLHPAPDASREILARRLWFDLLGLPPSPDELRAFIANEDPRAFEKVVDTLLDRPQFGERWARHWFDITRFAESVTLRGLVFDEAWRYRDYVIEAFNSDMPFDQFISEQIAGDLLPYKTAEERNRARIATTYLVLGNFNYEEQDKEQLRMDIVDEQLDTLGKGLLGETLGCARCHDHKTDPIRAAEYYAMAGILRNTRSAEHDNVSRWIEIPLEVSAAEEAALKEHERKLAELQRQIRRKVDQIAAITSGSAASSETTAPGPAGPAETPGAEAGCETDPAVLNAELERLRSEVQRESECGPKRPMAMSVSEEAVIEDGPFCRRGDVHAVTAKQPRGFLTLGAAPPETEFPAGESGRRQLAAWITSTNNPLTARVLVNRVWLWLFGEGIVRTPDNFGLSGEPPTHPELLDYLAAKFMREGWSLKKLVREIVLSRTWQLSSLATAEAMATDPENRLFLRANRRRLEPECLRDAILTVSGTLDLRRGGPSIRPGTSSDYGYVDASSRRSIYVPAFRNALPELFELFDPADPSTVTGRRGASIVAPQSLYFLNHPFILDQSRLAAAKLLSDLPAPSNEQRVEEMFRRVLGRKPTAGERAIMLHQLEAARHESRSETDAWSECIQALFASIDFRYVD